MAKHESEMVNLNGTTLLKVVCPKCGVTVGFAEDSKRTFVRCRKCGSEVVFSLNGKESDVTCIDKKDLYLFKFIPGVENTKRG